LLEFFQIPLESFDFIRSDGREDGEVQCQNDVLFVSKISQTNGSWVDSPMNAGALSPTSIPNDVTGVKNRLVRMIMAKVMRVRVFILSSCYFRI
jgi:hypothetical protein